MDRPQTVEQLRRVLEAIDAGELEAEPTERAYVAGALDALERTQEGAPGSA